MSQQDDDWEDDGYKRCDDCFQWVFGEAGHYCESCEAWICNTCWDEHLCNDPIPI